MDDDKNLNQQKISPEGEREPQSVSDSSEVQPAPEPAPEAGPFSSDSQEEESKFEIPESMRKLDQLLKRVKARPVKPIEPSEPKKEEPAPKKEEPLPKKEDANEVLVKMMQTKLDALGDKISDRIAVLLSELKNTVGPAREAKIKEITEMAGPDIIDISKLFDEKVISNIQEIGIEEKESKEVDKALEKLRKLRRGE